MSEKAILDAAPLMQGRVVERRQDIKTNLVKYIISSREFEGEVTSYRIQTAIERDLGLDIDERVIRNTLQELAEDYNINHIRREKFEIKDIPTVENFRTELDRIWVEYKSTLQSRDADQGIDYKLDNQEDAFKQVFIDFFDFLRGETDSLSSYTGDNKLEDTLNPIISEVAENKVLVDEGLFRNCFSEYISNESQLLLEFVANVYTGIINYDLLTREDQIEDINLESAPEDEKILILDTNILIGLLCETDQLYPVVSSMCDRAIDLGYDLYFTSDTAEELEYVIERAKKTITGFSESGADLDNQFVRDFRNSNRVTKSQYNIELDRWGDTLAEKWEISELDKDGKIAGTDWNLIKNWVKKLDQLQDDGTKSVPQINHDADLVSAAADLRGRTDREVVVGPFVVSNNDSLLSINGMGKGELWRKGIVLHPQDWLDYLIAFTPADFTKKDKEDIAQAVLSTATEFDDPLELEDYVDILSIRADLSSKSKSYLEDVVYGTPLESKLQDAIDRGNYDDLESQGEELLYEVKELLSENVEQREQLKEASSRVEEEKRRRKHLEELFEDMSGVEVDVSQEVEVTVNQQTIQQLEYFEDELRDALDGSFDDSPFNEPPDDYSDTTRVTEWLQSINETMSQSEELGQNIKKLQPIVTGLLAAFGL